MTSLKKERKKLAFGTPLSWHTLPTGRFCTRLGLETRFYVPFGAGKRGMATRRLAGAGLAGVRRGAPVEPHIS